MACTTSFLFHQQQQLEEIKIVKQERKRFRNIEKESERIHNRYPIGRRKEERGNTILLVRQTALCCTTERRYGTPYTVDHGTKCNRKGFFCLFFFFLFSAHLK